jgi:hypothetical protein
MTERSSQRRTTAATDANTANGADAKRDGIQSRPVSLAALQRDNVDAVIRSNLALIDGAVAWSNELLDFANAQVQTHWSQAYGFAPGPHPADVMAAQCLDHAARLMNIAARTAHDSCMPLAERAAAASDQFRRSVDSRRTT